VAYIGYNAGVRIAPSQSLPRRARTRLAWERLAMLAANVLVWVGVIAAVRAIF
jgi:uncharacterized membrane protein